MSNFSAGRLTNRLLFKDATKHSEIHRVMFCRDTRRTSLNNREWRKRKGKGPNICIDPGPISVNPAPIFPILPNAVRSTIDSTGYISKVVHCCFKCYTYLHTIHGIKLNWKIHGTVRTMYIVRYIQHLVQHGQNAKQHNARRSIRLRTSISIIIIDFKWQQ